MDYIRRPSIIITTTTPTTTIIPETDIKIEQQQQQNHHQQPSMTSTALYLIRFNVALQIAIAAMTVNLFLSIATFYYGWNSLYCAFGADSIIGVLTAIILIWRFASSKHDEASIINDENNNNNDELLPLLNSNNRRNSLIININDNNNNGDINNNEQQQHIHPLLRSLQSTINDTPDDNRRELWSTFWLGQIMIISGFSVIIRSIIELVYEIIEYEHNNINDDISIDNSNKHFNIMLPLFLLALISLSMNLILMAFKLFIYYHLNSNSMLIEGINSFISTIFALSTILSIQFHNRIKYLDEIVSILFGVFFISYGIYNVLHTLAYTLVDLIKQKYHQKQIQKQFKQQRKYSMKKSTSQLHLNLLLLNHHHHQTEKNELKKTNGSSLLRNDYLQLI